MMKGTYIKAVIAVMTTVAFTGCLRLDDNLYNQSSLTEYRFDHYTGEVDFRLDSSYDIPDSLIHPVTLLSQAPGESQSTKIYGVYIGNLSRIATDTVIMYCHGRRDHMDFYWPRAQLLAHAGHKNRFGVMMIDYRGFGMSQGEPSEAGLYADTDAALRWLKDRGMQQNRLVMYGFSLGAAPATKLTSEPISLAPEKLLLEAPFASAEVMFQDASGLALPGITVTDLQVNNADLIKDVQQPLFWIHGTSDSFINITTHGEVVFANHHGSFKEAHRISGADHSDIEEVMGFDTYLEQVTAFITRPN